MDKNKMMKQLSRMQNELAKAQDELAQATVEGSAGGGAVRVAMTGSEVREVSIDPSAIDEEDPSLLEDLVRAAINEALRAQQALTQERMGTLGAGIDIPGLG
ncbi:MAG: YbaB/EbfC family nucleoid-associated protein [Actinomycetota bacterium]